jgi:hypothetical protein
MPFKDFTAGDILTAADVDNLLMRQTVMKFDDAAARDTALVDVLTKGMFCFLDDTSAFQFYTGSAWQDVSNPGDITAVTAGTALSGGGTSGDVTIDVDLSAVIIPASQISDLTATAAELNFSDGVTSLIQPQIDGKIESSTVTTAGDLIVADGAGSVTRLGIGLDDRILTVVDGGLSWEEKGANNFVIDMNDSTNNTASTGGIKIEGPYSVSLSSGDSSFDIYLLNEAGETVGYSNGTSVTASASFNTVVILGVSSTEVISFVFSGSINNASSAGNKTGAGAYLSSLSPSDLPNINDTTTVVGGNFATDVEIYFTSAAGELAAKGIVRTNSTELIVTRPDALIEDNSPYSLKAINPGIVQPTGSNANILADAVTAGSDPTWVTSSPLNQTAPGNSFSQTLEASDSDGTIVSYVVTAGTITPGLTVESATGILSGTPTAEGDFSFTVTATDDGGNSTPKVFNQISLYATGGTVTTDDTYTYHTFTSSGTFEAFSTLPGGEYLVAAGGGGGGGTWGSGGGGGGILSTTATINAASYTITVGAGGAANVQGSSSSLGNLAIATGGGKGGASNLAEATVGGNGGSGGGGYKAAGGSGISGEGHDGGTGAGGTVYTGEGGGGGGKGSAGSGTTGGEGGSFAAWQSATSTGVTGNGGNHGGGGGGAIFGNSRSIGQGGGAAGAYGTNNNAISALNATSTSGGGGGGGKRVSNYVGSPSSGASGVVIVRYEK